VIKPKKKRSKRRRDPHAEVVHTRLRRVAELDAEARFNQDYVLVGGQLFHKRRLTQITREWQDRRIIF
jgi:hypothetical protein